MSISLESIRTDQRIKAPKVVLYGVGGIGKTTFASGDPRLGLTGPPKPIFIFTEDQPHLGEGGLDVARFEPTEGNPVVQSWQDILDCIGVIYQGEHDYGTVVIDTLDFAEPMLWEHVCRKYREDNIEAFGYGKGYIYACDEARTLLQGLDALRNERDMAVILIAHADAKRYAAPDHEPYDRYRLRLQERFGNLVHDWADAMLFANWRVHIVKDKQGSGRTAKETARGVGSGERVMYTEERPAWWAKNRYRLPYELPLSWQALQDAMTASTETPAEQKKTRSRKAATREAKS